MVNIYFYPKLLASAQLLRRHKRGVCRCCYDCDAVHMMSPKRWILLLIFYISYLMFGASIYYHIEHGLEKERRADQVKARLEINEYLLEQLADKNTTTQDEILGRLNSYCQEPVTDPTASELDLPYTWTFYHSFFFSFTVCSTVGYGNISPTTPLGRWIMIVYSVIGIPVNGILFAGLGEYFGKTFEAIYRRYKKYKLSRDSHYVPPQIGLVTTIILALIPGITLFLLLPAWVFSYMEDWPYSLAFYYSYVTTTTIGFGDYVATFNKTGPSKFGNWFKVYETFVIVWFIFSLGYLLMIMTFITRGLQSKRLSRLEQQLSTNIKATQNRIWNGVTKDVGYLRRILNELYILKMKPVYTEPEDRLLFLRRSVSCPELTMYRVEPMAMLSRKRAFSECYDAIEGRTNGTPPLIHAASDTDVNKFDKQKSFENAEAFRQTTGLLAKVVTALASIKPPAEEEITVGSAGMYGGYHGFTDSQILASEWSFPSMNDTLPPQPRGRASSDFNITPKWQIHRPTVQANEWTWSGDNNQIQEAINNRFRQHNREDLYRTSFGQPPQDYVLQMDNDELRKPTRTKKFSIPDGLRKLFPFRKRSSQEFLSESGPTDRKFSVVSVPESALQQRAPPLDYYGTITANATPTYFQNGKPATVPTAISPMNNASTTSIYPSDASNASRHSHNGLPYGIGNNQEQEAQGATALPATAPYQRKSVAPGAASGLRRRRESIFTQNPALANRRASMFPTSGAGGLTQRRGSLFDRRGSNASAVSPTPRTRPPPSDRRPSLFSVASDQDLDVLENTTLADLIRALEVMHTQAVLDDAAKSPAPRRRSELGGIFDRGDSYQRRKMGTAGISDMPPLLTLFAGNNEKALSATAANRLYARRSTIVGTLPSTSAPMATVTSTSSPAAINRRRPSLVTIPEPPPSYSEQDLTPAQTAPSTSNVVTKFKRRFSVRPTALQIPPGKAPPPGLLLQQPIGPTSPTSPPSQTVLQRRLSLRPSPLARELSIIPSQSPSSGSDTSSPASPAGGPISPNSATRLLPPRPSNPTSSSTHSPLSRIVQISQAQRKISMPEGSTKPESDKQA